MAIDARCDRAGGARGRSDYARDDPRRGRVGLRVPEAGLAAEGLRYCESILLRVAARSRAARVRSCETAQTIAASVRAPAIRWPRASISLGETRPESSA